jgi:hypothetical protein
VPGAGRPQAPTAVQALGDVHDTSLRKLGLVRLIGVGTGSTCQLEPFQRSVSAAGRPLRVCDAPTAMQSAADGHDTALKSQPLDATGFAVR